MQQTHYNYRNLLILLLLFFSLQNSSFAQFATNGNAAQTSSDCYRITNNTTTQIGSIYNTTPVDFSSDFTVGGIMNFGSNDANGADGFTFILTTSTTALGGSGENMGYGGIFASLTIEFDTWQNTNLNDPAQDHIAITSLGMPNHSGISSLAAPVTVPNLENGEDHCFTITWSAATQTLSATIAGATVSYTGNIPLIFFSNAPNIYYGFTSSTGGATNEHNICFEEPIFTPMQDQEICQGESVELQADPNGNSYTWTPNPTLSSFNISNPTATPPVTTLYDVTIGFDCGSPVIDDVLVTVLPAPTAVALSNSPLCVGATLELSAVGTGTYSWTGPDGFSSTLQNPTIPNITIDNAGDYTVEIEGPNGCVSSASVTVIIFPSFVIIVPQPPLCQNQTQVQLEGIPAGGTWGGVADADGFVYPSVLATGMHTVTYSGIGANGCQGMDEIMIEVLPAGMIDISSPFEFCVTETLVTLAVTPTGGTWGGVANVFGEINPLSLGEGMHTVTYSVGGGNCSSDTTFMIEVLEQPSITIMTDAPYCADAGLQTLTASEPDGIWGGAANVNGVIDPATLGEGSFEVTYTTSGNCPGMGQYFVDINATPTATLGQGGNFCTGSDGFPLEITSTGASPINVSYTINNIPQPVLSLATGTTILDITTPGICIITGVSDANGCEGLGSNSIEIFGVDTPQLVSLDANCNATQTDYQVTFEVTGGDPATYMVASAIGGSFSPSPPYVFTSDFIPSGDNYTFLVSDVNQCDTLEVTGSFSCQCLEVMGTNDAAICDGESILLAGEMQNTNGMYVDTLVNINGCDSILTTTLTVLQTDTIYLPDTFTCDPNEVGTFMFSDTNQAGCDSTEIVNVILSNSQTYNITSTTCIQGEEGVFINEYTTSEGCDSIVIETISLLTSDTIYLPDTFTCDPDSVGNFMENTTNQLGCDSTIFFTINLAPSELINVPLTSCNPDDVGEVIIMLTNQFGCDSIIVETTTLLSESDCGVNGTVVGSTIPCEENTGSFTLNMEFGQGPFDISWTGAESGLGTIENVGENIDFTNLSAGTYEINITDANGFSTILTTEIIQNSSPDLTAFITSDYNGFNISCVGGSDGAAQAEAINGQAPYSYFWSNGETTNAIENLAAGTYFVTVTDALNCDNETDVILTEPDILSLIFEVSDLDCFGQNDGSIVAVVAGGVPPYAFILNDSDAQESNIFTGLTDGIFTITVEDANGCKTSEAIGINAPLEVDVELGENLNIELGDNSSIVALTNIDAIMIDSIDWTGVDSSECPECLTQFVTPLFTTTYSVNITAENGCTGSDDLTIFVDRDKNIFVPTAFSPDSDLNNLAMIFAAENVVTNVKEFKIVNRWGNMLFEYYNFLPNDPTFGWNGVFRNQPMNTGVYIWYAVVEFVDGETELFKGDITLIR